MSQSEAGKNLRNSLRKHWKEVTAVTSEVDITFLVLRIVSLVGGLVWLAIVPYSVNEKSVLLNTLICFFLYSLGCYIMIFFKPAWLKKIYTVSFFFDIIFLANLVYSERSFENSFFLGFYLLVCLHTIYFGLRFGLLVATLSTFFYLLSVTSLLDYINWTDLVVRIVFLYFITVPLGLLSEKAKRDQKKVDDLDGRLVQAQENIRMMQEKLIAAGKFTALGRLTADLAYEIRNSLMTVGGSARRLQKTIAADAKEKEYSAMIVDELDRLDKIVVDTISYSKAEDVELVRHDLGLSAQAAAGRYRALCRERRIILEEHYASGLPLARVDDEHLQQALDVLIGRGIEAMPVGGVLELSTGRDTVNDTPYLTLSISDTGTGISHDVVQFIHEPFYAISKIGFAAGLGLALLKKIMEEHRGFVRVKNQVKGGALFTLFFPLQSEEQDRQIPCWEFLGCGIETDPSRRCPAYPHFGRICWATSGSVNENRSPGAGPVRIETCKECSFYRLVNNCLPNMAVNHKKM
jgi:signal transduction histidine kinase